MAAAFGALGLVWPSTPPLDSLFRCPRRRRRAILPGYGGWRAMVQQQSTQGASVSYAREMERLSAKESLLLAVSFSFFFPPLNFKDSPDKVLIFG